MNRLRSAGLACLMLAAQGAGITPGLAYTAYVSNEKGNSISVVDTEAMKVTAVVKTGQRPRGIETSTDGKFIYAAVGDDDTIQVIDTTTLKIVGKLPSGSMPTAIWPVLSRVARSMMVSLASFSLAT